MSDKTCPMCGAISNSTAVCPACGEIAPKPVPSIKRLFLGLPLFESFFALIFLTGLVTVMLLPILARIRSLFAP